ncbi:insulin-like peptide INSL6 isoform X2 [Papio anubis]|uniref:insulin-like peptide INSL6 isoform X2 n=1 Tax=Papio anubis TaxID=9555 RepID=UPI0012ADB226|nr:insulin-like peptide INSL6 isoform X2 [Papio anubis]
MLRHFCLCMLWLGLLLVRFSRELSDISSARKLCGRYLVKEIEKLCGHANWSQFHFEEETPFPRLVAQASEKVEAFSPYQFESPQTAFPARGRGTNPDCFNFLLKKKANPAVSEDGSLLTCVYFCLLGRSSKQLGNAVTT